MRVPWRTLKDAEWAPVNKTDHHIACCDCGLVHRVNFRTRKGRLELQAFRDNRRTAARRREGNKTGKYSHLLEWLKT